VFGVSFCGESGASTESIFQRFGASKRSGRERLGWTDELGGTLTVDMCLQCQIDRSKNQKEHSSSAS
jgi:hypothetical protein